MATEKLPTWLPQTIELDDYDGKYHDYMDALYKIFVEDFFTKGIVFQGKPVYVNTKIEESGRYERFEHITSEYDTTRGERLPCMGRCERICWIKAIFDNIASTDTKILIWEKPKSRTDLRINIFLPDLQVHIVLRKMKKSFTFITMIYPIEPHQKAKYLKEYERYK